MGRYADQTVRSRGMPGGGGADGGAEPHFLILRGVYKERVEFCWQCVGGIGLGAMVAGTVLFQMAMKPEGLAGIFERSAVFWHLYSVSAVSDSICTASGDPLARRNPNAADEVGTGCRGGAAGVGKRAGCSWCLSGCRPQHDVGESRGFKMEAA